MRLASLNRIGGNGLADYLKKSAIGAVIACIMLVMSLQGGASAKNIEDPMMLAGVVEYVAPGAGYEKFSIANGDPNEEQGGDRPGGARIQPAPQPAVLPDIQGSDPQDQPVEQPDYSNFTIANGDPNEEQGGDRPGGGRVQPAPQPAVLPDLQAGDDGDKPVDEPDYSGFTIANGDPNEEGNQ